MIDFRTLGGVSLSDAGAGEVDSVLAQPKRLALLAYLALARPRGFHRRNTLLALFWPEQDEKHARWSLNQALRHLRKGLGRGVLLSRGSDEVGLDFENVSMDAAAFEEACEQSKPEVALGLYRGHLLEGLHVSNCGEFERWLDGERTRLCRLAVEAAWALTDRLEEDGEIVAAAESARRAVDLSVHDETGIRRLIELLDRTGDRAGAVRAYEDHARQLQEVLDVEPAPETQSLIAAVRSRQPTPDAQNLTPPLDRFREAVVGGDPDEVKEANRDAGLTHLTGRFPYLIAATALALAVIGYGLFVMIGDRGGSAASPQEVEDAAPGIAVLPFSVSGSNLDDLAEGMVILLFHNLDGVSGIRLISSSTVLARWGERVVDESQVDLATRLEVAESCGARYAVVGSVVAIGPEIRLAMTVYETASAQPIGRANESASRDNMWDALDRLSVQVVAAIAEVDEGELARIDLRGVTTGSPDALRAYLMAESFYRQTEFEAAASQYDLAIAADSTFGLAHLGLGWSLSWNPLLKSERASERQGHMQEAVQYARTKRQDLTARASLHYERPFMRDDLVGELQQAVRRYPDDAGLWYLLGEHYLHVGTTGAFDDYVEEAERAFERATALWPGFVPYRLHLADMAFVRADSARARELIDDISRLVNPGSRTARELRAQFRLVFSASPEGEAFHAAMDTLQRLGELGRLYVSLLAQPNLWPVAQAVIERLNVRDCVWRQHSLMSGHVRIFVTEAVTAPANTYCLYLLDMMDLPVSERLVDSSMTARLASTLASGANGWEIGDLYADFGLAAYLTDRGRWADYDRLLEVWRSRGPEALTAEEPELSQRWPHSVTALEAYREWRHERPQRAVEILEELPPGARLFPPLRWWLGDLYMELDRPADAVRQYRSLQGAYPAPNWTLAYYRLGQAYEQLGEVEKAREQYAYFVDAWKDTDPELQPWLEQGRARLEALATS